MKIALKELVLTNDDLLRLLAWVTTTRADLNLKEAQFTPEGVVTRGTMKTPLGSLGYEMKWALSFEGKVVLSKLLQIKLGQSLPVPFLKSMVLEQIHGLLKGFPGVESQGETIRINGSEALSSQGVNIEGEMVSLDLINGEMRVQFS